MPVLTEVITRRLSVSVLWSVSKACRLRSTEARPNFARDFQAGDKNKHKKVPVSTHGPEQTNTKVTKKEEKDICTGFLHTVSRPFARPTNTVD